MTTGEKGMGETLKRIAKECQNDANLDTNE